MCYQTDRFCDISHNMGRWIEYLSKCIFTTKQPFFFNTQIPEGNTKAIANSATVTSSTDLFCGRFFSITVDATASATVCCKF